MFVNDEMSGGGGGALVFEVGYHPRKKIHIIRVVFQDRTMYLCTSFRVAKLEKKGVFCHFYKFREGHDGKIKKNTCKIKHVIRVYFHTWKICA